MNAPTPLPADLAGAIERLRRAILERQRIVAPNVVVNIDDLETVLDRLRLADGLAELCVPLLKGGRTTDEEFHKFRIALQAYRGGAARAVQGQRGSSLREPDGDHDAGRDYEAERQGHCENRVHFAPPR